MTLELRAYPRIEKILTAATGCAMYRLHWAEGMKNLRSTRLGVTRCELCQSDDEFFCLCFCRFPVGKCFPAQARSDWPAENIIVGCERWHDTIVRFTRKKGIQEGRAANIRP